MKDSLVDAAVADFPALPNRINTKSGIFHEGPEEMSDLILKDFQLTGPGLTVLASFANALIHRDLHEEDPAWIGTITADELDQKADWSICWENMVRDGLMNMQLLIRPNIFSVRNPDFLEFLSRLCSRGPDSSRLQILVELSAFEGYWPLTGDFTGAIVFCFDKLMRKILSEISATLGFPDGFGTKFREDAEALYLALFPIEKKFHRRVRLPTDEFTIEGKSLSAPFVQREFLVLWKSRDSLDKTEIVAKGLAGLGAGMAAVSPVELEGCLGAWVSGGWILDNHMPTHLQWLLEIPYESLVMAASKLLVFYRSFYAAGDRGSDLVLAMLSGRLDQVRAVPEAEFPPHLSARIPARVALLERVLAEARRR